MLDSENVETRYSLRPMT